MVTGAKLLRVQEPAVLQALRDTAGALSDLAEQAGPVLQRELDTSGGFSSTPPVNPGGPATGSREAPENVSEEKDPKVKKKEEKGEKRTGDKPAPEKKGSEKKKRRKVDTREKKKKAAAHTEEEEEEKSPKETREERGARGTANPADQDVENNPRRYGLEIIPRGTARAHFEERHHGGSGAVPPPEPVLPPRHRGGTEPAGRGRSRSPERKTERGTKGSKHTERGRDRARAWRESKGWRR